MGNSAPDGHGSSSDQAAAQRFTERANRLLAAREQHDRRTYSPAEFAKLIQDEIGESVSHTWVWKLRNGGVTNPTMRYVEMLARFFGVRVEYFFADEAVAERVEAQQALLYTLQEAGIQSIARLGPEGLRIAHLAEGVAPETLNAITVMLKTARQAQGLEEAKTGPAGE